MSTDVGPLEDAALLRPETGRALVFTVDFITPIVDDPVLFGAIAAANAMSDVYAMGGEPRVALAVCGFPGERLPTDVLAAIFRGGRDKAAEAGCAIVGGHTVLDAELKYGLCVLGVLDGERSLAHTGARAGDALVLTKPLGFGIASQAIKKERLSPAQLSEVAKLMCTLNKGAKDAALAAGAHAATDVTGFGFLGHLHHMVAAAGLSARVRARAVPVLDFARPLAEAGLVPGGSKNNRAYVDARCDWDSRLDDVERTLLTDAQTSGGLLIAVARESLPRLLAELERNGAPVRAVVGEIVAGESGRIEVSAED